MSLFSQNISANYEKLAYDFNFNDLDGSPLNLSEYKNKVIVVVNVASQCGFTSQYEDMQKIWIEYKSKGVVVIGVPSNDFNQELTTDKEIQDFCKLTYAVEFPMMSKSSVIGPKANPVYKNLASITGEAPLWNFYKFLVMPNAESVHVFGSMTSPNSKKIINLLKPYINN